MALRKRLVILTSLLPFLVFSQVRNFRNYSVDDGLPFVQVSTLHQDINGYLWSGAYGGLSKFDGKAFVNYSPRHGLSDHTVNAIASGKDGIVWIGTVGGISRFDGNKFTTYKMVNGLPDDRIHALVVDENNRVWAGTAGGLGVSSGSGFAEFSGNVALKNSRVLSLHLPFPGTLLVGTDRGLFVISTSSAEVMKHYSVKEGLVDSIVTAISSRKDNSFVIGTQNGISLLKGDVFTNIYAAEGLVDNEITSLVAEENGAVWIGTLSGLSRFADNTFVQYKTDNTFNGNKVYSLYIDREKNLWVGTSNGMYKHSGSLFTSYSTSSGLSSEFIFPIQRGPDGTLWIGSDNGLNYLKNGKVGYLKKEDGLAGNTINDLEIDNNGVLYIGTNQGLSIGKPGSFMNFYGKKAGLISDSVTAVLLEENGKLWMGGHNGVTTYENGIIRKQPLAGVSSSFDVWIFFKDSKGRIWMGAYQGGVFMYDGTTYHDMTVELNIPAKSFLAINEDEAGNIFLGSLSGVFIWTGKELLHLNETKGLSSDLIYVLGPDQDPNYLWIGSNQGMDRLDLKSYFSKNVIAIDHFGREDGFIFGETNSNGYWKDPDGVIWYGTVGGVIRYDPSALREKTLESMTHLTSIRLFYNDTLLAEGSELPHDVNHIAFSFIGIHFANPTKVQYQYKLSGFESEWSPVTSITTANFPNLPSGTYTFMVKSSNGYGVWNKEPVSFTFTILTPWYKTWWFRVALVAATLLSVFFVLRLRVAQVRTREQNRTRLAAMELKALRAQMNPHFIFNALNSIQHFIMRSDEGGAAKYLNKFARLIRTILNNSERSQVSLEEEVESLKLYLELEVLRFENKFTYEINISPELNLDFHEIPTMLIQPYVENAILHGLVPGKIKGHLTIELKSDENHIICVITDDGIGRSASRIMKERSMKQQHLSFGMKITHDRLELLNSVQKSNLSVNIADLENVYGESKGTQVEIFIPIT